MRQHGEPEPHGDAVDGSEKRHGDFGQCLEEADEALSGTFDRRAGREGGHFGQVLTGTEGGPAAGEHERSDGRIAVRRTQGLGHLKVHRRIERISDVGTIECDQPDSRRDIFDLDLAHGHPTAAMGTLSGRTWGQATLAALPPGAWTPAVVPMA